MLTVLDRTCAKLQKNYIHIYIYMLIGFSPINHT